MCLKAALVVLADGVVVAQQLVTAQHQLAKIHHAFALALLFVELVNLDLLARLGVARLHVVGAQAVFLAASNKPRNCLGGKRSSSDVVLLAQAFDGARAGLACPESESVCGKLAILKCARKKRLHRP